MGSAWAAAAKAGVLVLRQRLARETEAARRDIILSLQTSHHMYIRKKGFRILGEYKMIFGLACTQPSSRSLGSLGFLNQDLISYNSFTAMRNDSGLSISKC